MQQLGKFSLKINIMLNGLEKYMSLGKLRLIDNFQFVRFSLDGLLRNLNKDDFKYLSQVLDNKVLDLIKQKIFCPYEYMSNFENFKEELPSKKKFYMVCEQAKTLKNFLVVMVKITSVKTIPNL